MKNLPADHAAPLASLADCKSGQVSSRQFAAFAGAYALLLAFGAGESVSEETYPGDALVTCIAGKGEVTLEGVPHVLTCGQAIVMPADADYAVRGIEGYKMLLTVVKA